MAIQKELFVQLANPNKDCISRWVDTTEFIEVSPLEIIENKKVDK